MKKILSLALSLLAAFSLTACGFINQFKDLKTTENISKSAILENFGDNYSIKIETKIDADEVDTTTSVFKRVGDTYYSEDGEGRKLLIHDSKKYEFNSSTGKFHFVSDFSGDAIVEIGDDFSTLLIMSNKTTISYQKSEEIEYIGREATKYTQEIGLNLGYAGASTKTVYTIDKETGIVLAFEGEASAFAAGEGSEDGEGGVKVKELKFGSVSLSSEIANITEEPSSGGSEGGNSGSEGGNSGNEGGSHTSYTLEEISELLNNKHVVVEALSYVNNELTDTISYTIDIAGDFEYYKQDDTVVVQDGHYVYRYYEEDFGHYTEMLYSDTLRLFETYPIGLIQSMTNQYSSAEDLTADGTEKVANITCHKYTRSANGITQTFYVDKASNLVLRLDTELKMGSGSKLDVCQVKELSDVSTSFINEQKESVYFNPWPTEEFFTSLGLTGAIAPQTNLTTYKLYYDESGLYSAEFVLNVAENDLNSFINDLYNKGFKKDYEGNVVSLNEILGEGTYFEAYSTEASKVMFTYYELEDGFYPSVLEFVVR